MEFDLARTGKKIVLSTTWIRYGTYYIDDETKMPGGELRNRTQILFKI